MTSQRHPGRRSRAIRQRGQAVLLAVILLAIGITALVYNLATPGRTDIAKDKVTAAALEQAKAALIGYALSVNLSTDRLGDLPCPDTNDSGTPDAPCTTPVSRIGRLPWKTLGLPDLRDGDGERLWYAVSTNFKKNYPPPSPPTCTSPGNADCLNSDTRGTITVRNSAGTVVYDGSNPDPYTPSGVIAVIIAPGGVLQRQDTGTTQLRDCSGAGCGVTGTCNSTATPKCNPINYLDILNGTEDNAAFTDSSAADGFIQGVIRDASNNIVVNDRLIVITYQDLMPALERRAAAEVMSCLTAYASTAQNNGRYPWAAPVGNWPSFADQVDTRFGRVPDTLTNTQLGAVGGIASALVCGLIPGLCMSNTWPMTNTSCSNMSAGIWWANWKELVFYGVADAYKPADPISLLLGVSAPGGCGSCLTVDPPSPTADKKVVVVVAGKRLSSTAYPTGSGQPRTVSVPANKQDPTNYLEGENDNTATSNVYEQQTISNSFSDYLLYQ